MPAQPIEEFLNNGFLVELARTLDDLGFVADEHDFAPCRETMYKLVEPINDALGASGREFELAKGFVEHPRAGYAYFIYDSKRFTDYPKAADAVTKWLEGRYSQP